MFGDYEAQRHWMEITLHTPWAGGTARRRRTTPDTGVWTTLPDGVPELGVRPRRGVVRARGRGARHVPRIRDFVQPPAHALERRRLRPHLLLPRRLRLHPRLLRRPRDARPDVVGARGGARRARGRPHRPRLFQYNGISLETVTAAAAAVVSDRDLLGAALFSLALNHKQMSLYYAPAFSRTCSASAFDAHTRRQGAR